MLTDKDAAGDYEIPHIIYSDAYFSETVAYADLVLPDTTYLERWDCISLLDRPIGSRRAGRRHPPAGGRAGPRRAAVPGRADRARRAARPAGLRRRGRAAELPGLRRLHREPRAQPGRRAARRLARRGRRRARARRAEPGPARALHRERLLLAPRPAAEQRYFKMANRAYLDFAVRDGVHRRRRSRSSSRSTREPLQNFRLAARGPRRGAAAGATARAIETYFDPLPIWYAPLEEAAVDADAFPLHALTQRPMHMYHSWGSQNAWLRQITSQNRLFVHRETARAARRSPTTTGSGSRAATARVKGQVRLMDGVNPDTVWTWNAIGKRAGAWMLDGRRAGGRARLPAQPRHQRAAAARAERPAPLQLRPGDRPGGVVRPARRVRRCERGGGGGRREPQFPALQAAAGLAARAGRDCASAHSSGGARGGAMTSLPHADRARSSASSSTSTPASAARPA